MSYFEKVRQGEGNAGSSPWAVSGSLSIGNFPAIQTISGTTTVLQGISPWTVSGNIQGIGAAGASLVGVNPVVIGMNSSGGTSRFITSASSTRNTNGVALLGVGVQRYDPANLIYVDELMPSVFKTATATASGSTALWTPTTGKKFRIMKYMVEVSNNTSLATGAVLNISLLDGNSPISQSHSVFIPTTAILLTPGNALTTPWIDLSNGILSAVINNVLNISLDAALATGICRLIVAGTEE